MLTEKEYREMRLRLVDELEEAVNTQYEREEEISALDTVWEAICRENGLPPPPKPETKTLTPLLALATGPEAPKAVAAPAPDPISPDRKRRRGKRPTFQEMAAAAADGFKDGIFTSAMAVSEVLTRFPFVRDTPSNRASVSGALKTLADNERLVLVESGRGSRPSRYRKVQLNGRPTP